MIIEQLAVLRDNYVYLLHDEATGATGVVDPAVAGPVLDRLKERGWRLTHILNTHHHHDHTGGNLELKAATGAVVVGAAGDESRIPGIDVRVGEGDVVQLGNARAKVFDTPGHTIGHIAYWFAADQALFCGDTLFSLGCGRLFEGSAEQMWSSLSKLRALPGEARVYCAHEYTASNARFALSVEPGNERLKAWSLRVPTVPSLLEDERAANPFLRADRLAEAVGMPGAEPAAVFAELRKRKDVF